MENGTPIQVLLEFGELSIRNDSVVMVNINPGAHLRLIEAKKLLETIHNLSRYTSRPVLVDLRHIAGIDAVAKLYLLGKSADNHNQCMAIVIDSTVGRMMANLSLLFKQTGCPVLYFNQLESALKWCQKHVVDSAHGLQTVAA